MLKKIRAYLKSRDRQPIILGHTIDPVSKREEWCYGNVPLAYVEHEVRLDGEHWNLYILRDGVGRFIATGPIKSTFSMGALWDYLGVRDFNNDVVEDLNGVWCVYVPKRNHRRLIRSMWQNTPVHA